MSDRVRRTAWLDWYVGPVTDSSRAGDSAVLLGDAVAGADSRVVVLSALATALLADVPEVGATLDELGAGLAAAFGAPPESDPLAATREVVAELVEHGVLAWAGPDGRAG